MQEFLIQLLALVTVIGMVTGANIRTKKMGGPVPLSGRCVNAGSFSNGNHWYVLLLFYFM